MRPQTRTLRIEPGGGRRSVARASVAATLRTAWAGVALGLGFWSMAALAFGAPVPAKAASKKAFWAARRASLRPGWMLVGAGGQTGGRIGAAMSALNTSNREHG